MKLCESVRFVPSFTTTTTAAAAATTTTAAAAAAAATTTTSTLSTQGDQICDYFRYATAVISKQSNVHLH